MTIHFVRWAGWLIPDLACCLRCHLSGGDHHACWIDRCPARHVR